MPSHQILIQQVKLQTECTAKTPRQFAALPFYDYFEAKEWYVNADESELARARVTAYSLDGWELSKLNPNYATARKASRNFDQKCKSFILPKGYVNNTDPKKKYVYSCILTIHEKGEIFVSYLVSASNKFLCVGGPFNKLYQAYDDVKDEYSMFNNNGYSRSKNSHSAILVHTSIVE